MEFTETMLENYSQPLSTTEDALCKNAIRMVRDALKPLGFTDDNKDIASLYSDTLAYSIEMRSIYGSRKIKLFIQGSYANNTCVRTESDVDIAVVQEDVFKSEYRIGVTKEHYGFETAPTPPISFKDEVQEALTEKFGANSVERKNKSIKVYGNTYRKDADTVPCRRYRDYRNDYSFDENNYIGGIVIYPDDGGLIINYPEQHIYNGRQKNIATNSYYKKMVRIMKKMRYLMEDYRIKAANNVSSFMLESFLWNVADEWYLEYCGKYRKVFAFHMLISHLKGSKGSYMSYKEANGIKPLCSDITSYNNLCTFIDELDAFYTYK